MTPTSHRTVLSALALAPLLALGGCLEREETIEVRPDGSLAVRHEVAGDRWDLESGAARYPGDAHFAVEQTTRERDDGETERVRTARAEFPSAEDVPGRFGAADAPFPEAALARRTRLWIQREGDRTRYVFLRTFAPRAWAPYAHLREQAFPQGVQELLKGERPWGERPEAERRRIVDALVAWERGKAQRWAAEAAAAVLPAGPRRVEGRLAVRDAVARAYAERLRFEDADRALAEGAGAIHRLADDVEGAVERAVEGAGASALGLDALGLDRLMQGLRSQRRTFEVTEDLGDESFVVRLRLPGRVTAHDGELTDGGEVVWRFGGKDLRDRAQRLVAVSVLEDG